MASMKQDFTGYEVDPEVLLRMKITDIDSEINKERFKLAKERKQDNRRRFYIDSYRKGYQKPN